MTALDEKNLESLRREYDRLTADLMHYYDSIVATERLAIAGAAGVAAFLYTKLPVFAAGQSVYLSALPAAIVILAALRCFSIYLVMLEITRYLRRLECKLITLEGFGFQREFAQRSKPQRHLVEVTSAAFWILATLITLFFWWVYVPPTHSAG